MKYEWLDEYLLAKKAAVKDYKVEWDAIRYMVGEKMFCMFGDMYSKPIVSFKCEPLLAENLRAQYADIIPGYYLNKAHWNSIYLDGEVPDDVMKSMADMSYELICNSLTKKVKTELSLL